MEYKVSAGIPISPHRRPLSGLTVQLLALAVGSSLFVPEPTSYYVNGRITTAKRDGRRFATRTVVEDGVRGVRIWRTA